MSNMIDYLRWRGDLTFEQDPFNEVDNMILCQISYVNVDENCPGLGEKMITLEELSRRFFDTHTEEELAQDKTFAHESPSVLREAAQTRRFKDALVGNFVNFIVPERMLQMSAMEMCLSDGTSFVAYRGTDDRLVSWKEDFRLASGEVAAHSVAINYLNRVGRDETSRKLRIGGHSKGGHLAVYASAFCEEAIRNRILQIYNDDGPGFRQEFLESEEYARVHDRILRLIPEESIVGLLLDHKSEPAIVASDARGINQHNALSWQVMGNRFTRKEQLNFTSIQIDTTMSDWLNNYEDDKRIRFIDEIFGVLEAPGAETLTELQSCGISGLLAMRKKAEQVDPEIREMLELLLRTMVANWSDYIAGEFQKIWESLPLIEKKS